MFEKAFGSRAGLVVWRIFFSLVLVCVAAIVIFGAIAAFQLAFPHREVPAFPTQTAAAPSKNDTVSSQPISPPKKRASNEAPSLPAIVAPGSILFPSGGFNTVNNFGPQPRDIDSPRAAPLRSQMLSEIPRDKPITVTAIMGDTESIQFATQILAFLKANGFTLKENGISQAVFDKPVKGIALQKEQNGELTLIVGANL